MSHYVFLIIIGLLYWADKINGTIAAILIVGLFIVEHFEAQEKKIDELSEKLDELGLSDDNDDYNDHTV